MKGFSFAFYNQVFAFLYRVPSLGLNPFDFLYEFFIPKTRVLGLSVVFTQYQRVTDRRTASRRRS